MLTKSVNGMGISRPRPGSDGQGRLSQCRVLGTSAGRQFAEM
jgi:hypothetical protein